VQHNKNCFSTGNCENDEIDDGYENSENDVTGVFYGCVKRHQCPVVQSRVKPTQD